MKFTHILIVNRGKFHLISPINKNFSVINVYKRSRLRERQKRYISEIWPPILMKLSTNHYQYMGELHAKFHQNRWSGFRDIALHDTQGHSFIIIRIHTKMVSNPFKQKQLLKWTYQKPYLHQNTEKFIKISQLPKRKLVQTVLILHTFMNI